MGGDSADRQVGFFTRGAMGEGERGIGGVKREGIGEREERKYGAAYKKGKVRG